MKNGYLVLLIPHGGKRTIPVVWTSRYAVACTRAKQLRDASTLHYIVKAND